MPELAEVEYYRKQWDPGLDKPVLRIHLHDRKRLFRGGNPAGLARSLPKTVLQHSQCSGKWMLFHFAPSCWTGIHLGMTGSLRIGQANHLPGPHDHLVLYQKQHSLIFSDPRLFGRVLFQKSNTLPDWWQKLPPSLLSPAVNFSDIASFLTKRGRSPVKAVLLMQERFPGIGNWMADEILWRAGIHPRRPAGSLTQEEQKKLWKETRRVVKDAFRVIGTDWSEPPDSWLFNHRWKNGGHCPASGARLIRETIGGRTTCWSPGKQS